MSVTYISQVVVGVPLSDILIEKQISEMVTKYNENTGKPFIKEVKSTKYFINNKEVDFDGDIEGLPLGELSVFHASSECNPNHDDIIIGLEVAECQPCDLEIISLIDIEHALVSVKKQLQDLGVSEEPELYLISYAG